MFGVGVNGRRNEKEELRQARREFGRQVREMPVEEVWDGVVSLLKPSKAIFEEKFRMDRAGPDNLNGEFYRWLDLSNRALGTLFVLGNNIKGNIEEAMLRRVLADTPTLKNYLANEPQCIKVTRDERESLLAEQAPVSTLRLIAEAISLDSISTHVEFVVWVQDKLEKLKESISCRG